MVGLTQNGRKAASLGVDPNDGANLYGGLTHMVGLTQNGGIETHGT